MFGADKTAVERSVAAARRNNRSTILKYLEVLRMCGCEDSAALSDYGCYLLNSANMGFILET